MKLSRKSYVLHVGSEVKETQVETYEQPIRDRIAYLAFYAFWLVCWKVKPVSWLIEGPLDKLSVWLHERKCDGKCSTWTKRDGTSGKACYVMSLDARLDCKLFDLDRRRNTHVHRRPS